MICDDEGHFEVQRAGVLPLREPLAYRWYQFPRLYPAATNHEAAVAGEPVDFLRKPHLCVDMLDRTDTEAIEEAIAITDGFAHYAGLEWGSRGTAHADYRRQKAEKVKEAAEAEAETEADAEGAVAMEYAGMRWVVVP